MKIYKIINKYIYKKEKNIKNTKKIYKKHKNNMFKEILITRLNKKSRRTTKDLTILWYIEFESESLIS